MRIPVLLCVVILLSGCGSLPGYSHPTSPTPSPALVSITLNQPLTVRPDRASEYIQYGEVKPYDKVSEYHPHCIFELRTLSEQARTVQADTFSVTAIKRDRFMASMAGVMLAGGGDGYNMVMSSTVLSLHSDRQPEVLRLTCQQLDDPYRVHHLTVEEMQNTLGGLFTLQ
jgi:hypothetical protein